MEPQTVQGTFKPVQIIKTTVPPSMKSAGGTSKSNYHTAYIAVSNKVSDQLQLNGELGNN